VAIEHRRVTRSAVHHPLNMLSRARNFRQADFA
jgi:hypothetical protein